MKVLLMLVSACLAFNGAYGVIGGRDATIEEFPYTVSLENGNAHSATGVLVASDVVLTSAASIIYDGPMTVVIRAGSTTCSHYKNPTTEGETAEVSRIYRHPRYLYPEIQYNIAVLHLKQKLTLGPKIQPIPLIEKGLSLPEHSLATITGWGGQRFDLAKVLQAGNLPKISFDKCVRQWRDVTSTSMCYGYYDAKVDFSAGDRGGPLVSGKKLVGIVSRGVLIDITKKPSIYVDLSHTEIHDFVTGLLTNPDSQ